MKLIKNSVFTIFLILFCASLFAQAPDWLWAKRAGGTDEDICYSVARDNSGNYYVAGSFSGRVSFGSTTLASSGLRDIFVGKLNAEGNWLWAKKAGGTSNDVALAIAVDSAGNAYITGRFASSTLTFIAGAINLTRSGGDDLFVAKISSAGVWQWARKNSGGGTSSDTGNSIAVDADSNVYMTGYFRNNIAFTTTTGTTTLTAQTGSYYDMLVAKISSAGIWQWVIQGSGTAIKQGNGIAVDGQGNAYVTGGFNSPTLTLGSIVVTNRQDTVFDGFVAKASPEGQWLWADRFGGVNADLGSSIALDSTGNIYLTGFFNTTAYFGNLALTSPSGNGNEVFAAKLSPSGSWLWAKKAGGTGSDEGLGISLDANSNVFLAGRFTGTTNFGSISLTSASSDSSDAFLGKLNSAGDWQWAVRAGGIGPDCGQGVVAHGDSEALLYGYFCQSSDFSGTTLTSAGLSDAFFARITVPPLTLLTPNGGETYAAPSSQTITWTANGVDTVHLDYTLDGGTTWTTITGAPVSAGLGSYDWALPNSSSSQALVRVRNSVDSTVFDVSDAYFSIYLADVAPNAPSNLVAAVVSSSQINLSWADNSDNELQFKVERKTGSSGTWAQIGTVDANTVSFSNTGLSQNTTYYYRVRASNQAGNSGYSNEASGTTPYATPGAPSGLTATTLSSSRIRIDWTDNSNIETGFKVERKTGSTGTWSQIVVLGANTTTYTNSSLSQNTTYFYRVRAYNNNVNSDYSNEASATTLYATPAAPSNLRATAVSTSQIDLAWTDNSGVETGVKIERKTGSSGTWAQIATVGANVTAYSNTDLAHGTTYYYRVRAYNVNVNSTYSNEAYATTLVATLEAPGSLTASPVSVTSIELLWVDNSTEENGFQVERKTDVESEWNQIAQVPANSISYIDELPDWSHTISYRVRAFNDITVSDYSNVASVVPLSGPQAAFSATPVSGSAPLTVQFMDQSTAGTGSIVSWHWDFGDGGSSEEASPLHTYQNPGLYTVGLTVFDSYQNSDVLTQTDYITVLSNAPNLELLSPTRMDFGTLAIDSVSPYQPVIIRNTGLTDLHILEVNLISASGQFEIMAWQSGMSIAPGATDSLFVRYAPQSLGDASDYLQIVNDSANQPDCRIQLLGSAILPVPLPPANLQIGIQGQNTVLSWDPVTQNTAGGPIQPDYYFVFTSAMDPQQGFIFHGLTPDCAYSHPHVLLVEPMVFYKVKTVVLDQAVKAKAPSKEALDIYLKDHLKPGMSESEVSRVIDSAGKLYLHK
ncbi:MAG TPA: fibronectin type III domain-containing protein [Candidatus Cloacimonadota bacterium]|nr:fibronectin type III domain-containing protein [Candidatus Cloacimonadota bacterium]